MEAGDIWDDTTRHLRVVTWSVLGVLLRLVKDRTQAHGVLVLFLEANESLVNIIDDLRSLRTEGQVMQTRIVLVVSHVGSWRDADACQEGKKDIGEW